MQLALFVNHASKKVHFVEAKGTNQNNIERKPRQGNWSDPSQDFHLLPQKIVESLKQCVEILRNLNKGLLSTLSLYDKRFNDVLGNIRELQDDYTTDLLNSVVDQIKQIIHDLKEKYRSNSMRLSRAQDRALKQKPQRSRANSDYHPTDLRHDSTFKQGRIYLIETPFAQVFMVPTRGVRWMFTSYNYARGYLDKRPNNLPVSYETIARQLDSLNQNTKETIYAEFKKYVEDRQMPKYEDVTNSSSNTLRRIKFNDINDFQALCAGCLAAAWLLSESGPERIRVRGKLERSVLQKKFSAYGSFENLIASLPQAAQGGVRATLNAINGSGSSINERPQQRNARERAVEAIESIPSDNISESSDGEQSKNFTDQIETASQLLATAEALLKK